MEDFASLLVAARERAGLTQAHLATAAGLTPSYLSLIENRRKPPPSDTVCERLAAVLGVPARRLIEIAHLERAPHTVRHRVRTLSSKLARERRSTRRILESLLSPFLSIGMPDFLEGTLEWLGGSGVRRHRLREVLAALGRRHQDRATEVSRLVEELPERDRRLLLEALPLLLGARDPRSGTGTDRHPDLFYSVPAPGDAPPRPFLLVWNGGPSGGDVQDGDLLLVDPGLEPDAEDLVLLRAPDDAVLLRRVVRERGGYRFAPLADAAAGRSRQPLDTEGPELLDEAEFRAALARDAAGTVTEIRHPLRRRRA